MKKILVSITLLAVTGLILWQVRDAGISYRTQEAVENTSSRNIEGWVEETENFHYEDNESYASVEEVIFQILSKLDSGEVESAKRSLENLMADQTNLQLAADVLKILLLEEQREDFDITEYASFAEVIIASGNEQYGKSAALSLIMKWSEDDPTAAAKWLEKMPTWAAEHALSPLMSKWGSQDYRSAQKWLLAHSDRDESNYGVLGLVDGVADANPGNLQILAEIFDSVSDSNVKEAIEQRLTEEKIIGQINEAQLNGGVHSVIYQDSDGDYIEQTPSEAKKFESDRFRKLSVLMARHEAPDSRTREALLKPHYEGQSHKVNPTKQGAGSINTIDDNHSDKTAVTFKDSDRDGLPDWWEFLYGGTEGLDPNQDNDGDGLSNIYEYYLETNPVEIEPPIPNNIAE